MRRLFIIIASTLLLFSVVACQKTVEKKQEHKVKQDTPSTVSYKFLKAYLQNDYMEEQRYLYKKGSYELDKDKTINPIEFKTENIKGMKEYRDTRNEVVYVWMSYHNPHINSTSTEVYAVRKNNKGDYKIDINADFNFENIQEKFDPIVIDPNKLGV
ncbi:hypothetical protein [Bacillus sp. BP-3]|uniref:hypothetical protein n=1 Tax=Bacillus sp. BP-3 TaxID=3022773 RepID=UPI00232BD3B6|nr:hypothetical protein [Bacillus sp. BP-3]MDC2867750.1 hypothetical protein [Bacillus sp. BP-3]